LSELACAFAVHPVQIAQWKKQAVAALPQIFATRRDTEAEDHEALKAALFQEDRPVEGGAGLAQEKTPSGRPLTDAPRSTRRTRS